MLRWHYSPAYGRGRVNISAGLYVLTSGTDSPVTGSLPGVTATLVTLDRSPVQSVFFIRRNSYQSGVRLTVMVVASITFDEVNFQNKDGGSVSATLKMTANCIAGLPFVNIYTPEGAEKFLEASVKIGQSCDEKWGSNRNYEFGEVFHCNLSLKIVEKYVNQNKEVTKITEYTGDGNFFLRIGLSYYNICPPVSEGDNRCWAEALTNMVSWRDQVCYTVDDVLKMLDDNTYRTLSEAYRNDKPIPWTTIRPAGGELGMQVTPFGGGGPLMQQLLLNSLPYPKSIVTSSSA